MVKMYYQSLCTPQQKSGGKSKLQPKFKNIKNTYTIGECIGYGAYSKVHVATKKDDGSRVAVKVIHANQISKSNF